MTYDRLKEILKNIENQIIQPFYNRRKSSIQRYYLQLIDLYYNLLKLGYIIEKYACIEKLDKEYTDEWAYHNFYSDINKYIAGFLYDHTSTITYHRYRKLCIEALIICQCNIQEFYEYDPELIDKLSTIELKLTSLQNDINTVRYI